MTVELRKQSAVPIHSHTLHLATRATQHFVLNFEVRYLTLHKMSAMQVVLYVCS